MTMKAQYIIRELLVVLFAGMLSVLTVYVYEHLPAAAPISAVHVDSSAPPMPGGRASRNRDDGLTRAAPATTPVDAKVASDLCADLRAALATTDRSIQDLQSNINRLELAAGECGTECQRLGTQIKRARHQSELELGALRVCIGSAARPRAGG
jgi:hypothetical protein